MALTGPKLQTRRPTGRQREINLSGQGNSWDVSFSDAVDLTGAVTFRRNINDAGYPTISRHTLSIFDNGAIRFRDSQSVESTKRNLQGKLQNVELTIHAGIEVASQTYDVVRHEEDGQRWVTTIKLRPRERLVVITGGRPSTLPPTSELGFHMVRLWTQRAQVERMQYVTIVVHDGMNYPPWKVVMHKQVFGPVVSATVDNTEGEELLIRFADKSTSPSAENPKQETVPLAGPSLVHPPPAISPHHVPAPVSPEASYAEPQAPGILSSAQSSEREPLDPFEGIWEQARIRWLG